jgi:hypothetical protein
MMYEEFRATWDEALQESKLRMIGLHANETLDLRFTDRRYEVHVEPLGGQDAEPLFVAATLSWRWGALLTARAATKEEDMLVELFGRDGAAEMVTEMPSVMVRIKLNASTTWGQSLPMPSKQAWAGWVKETTGRLERIEPLLPEETARRNAAGLLEVLAWQEPPKAKVTCNPNGELLLEGVSISAGQLIEIPRVFDVGVEPDDGPHGQLREMFHRVRASLMAFMQTLDHLTKK